MSTDTDFTKAMAVMREVFHHDPSHAYGWHSNIAMACYDAIKTHDVSVYDPDSAEMSHEDALQVGNDAAARLMFVIFGVETSQDMLLKPDEVEINISYDQFIKSQEGRAKIQAECDHDWEDIGMGRIQCTYLDCQKVEDAPES